METLYTAKNFWMSPQNLTSLNITVPQGSTQHQNPHILCPASSPYKTVIHIITFFTTNYLAHAATVKATPGDSGFVKAFNILLALLFPTSGLIRGLNAIVRGANIGASELDKACKAGALIMVTRDHGWRLPERQAFDVVLIETTRGQSGQVGNPSQREAAFLPFTPTWARENLNRWIYSDTLWGRSRVNPMLSKIHGTYRLPPGYGFSVLPRNTLVEPSIAPRGPAQLPMKTDISSSISPAKAMSSIVQLLSALQSLAFRRTDTVRRWGYASYVLTVIPYSVMSLVNLISNICSPDYPCLYMVRTEIMTEAEQVNGEFEGVVGRTISANYPGDLGFGEGPDWEGVTVKDLLRTWVRLHRFSNFMAPDPPPVYTSTSRNITVTAGPHNLDAGTGAAQPGTEIIQTLIPNASNGISYRVTTTPQPENFMLAARQYVSDLLERTPLIPRRPEASTSRATDEDTSRHNDAGHRKWQTFKTAWKKTSEELWYAFRAAIGLGMKEVPSVSQETSIYYPSCTRFLRQDDDIDGTATEHNRRASSERREKPIGALSIAVYVVSALIFAGILIALNGALSGGFDPGSSSSTERGIMMAWLVTGIAVGIFLSLLSLLDWAKILVGFPIIGLLRSRAPGFYTPTWAAYLPIAAFVPPVWGFVLVGLMLEEWGVCVTLY